MERQRFSDKHVIVTGAARGIGFEIAKQFAREGALLSLIDNHSENLTAAATTFRDQGIVVNDFLVDISVHSQVADVVEKAEAIRPVDILVNNAGVAEEVPFLQIDEPQWRKIIDINLTGMFFMSQEVCRRMVRRKTGVVINMTSKNGLDGEFGYAHYNASKGGVVMLTKTMALELAPFGIRVNAVAPGYIQTPMSQAIDPPEFTKAFADRYIPMNRPGRPEEIAPVFLFLASDESSFITGQIIVADGGQLAGQKPGTELTARLLDI